MSSLFSLFTNSPDAFYLVFPHPLFFRRALLGSAGRKEGELLPSLSVNLSVFFCLCGRTICNSREKVSSEHSGCLCINVSMYLCICVPVLMCPCVSAFVTQGRRLVASIYIGCLCLLLLSTCLCIHVSVFLPVIMFPCVPPYLYVFLCIPVYLCVCVSFCLSIYLSVCVPVFLSISMYLCVYLDVSMALCLSIYLSVCVPVCLYAPVYLSASLSVCLSVYPSYFSHNLHLLKTLNKGLETSTYFLLFPKLFSLP